VGEENKRIHISFSTKGAISRRTTTDNKHCITIQGYDLHLPADLPIFMAHQTNVVHYHSISIFQKSCGT
jgi:hypothetical protein